MRNTATVLALVLTAHAGALDAQRRSSDGGFWYAVGVAPGWARVSCQLCSGSRRTGVSAFVALGGRTSRVLRIGGELAGWRKSDEGLTQTLLSFGGSAYWYATARRNLYLRGGAAWLMHRVNDGTDVVTSSGIGPVLGIGYEHAVSQHWLVAPFVHYSVGVAAGDVKFNGGQATGSATVSFLQVGASLTHR
jgi:hypothetical protein